MDEQIVDIDMKGAPACGRCYMLVARFAPQVSTRAATYHRECFEAWYFGRYGRRPSLVQAPKGARHSFQVREAGDLAA